MGILLNLPQNILTSGPMYINFIVKTTINVIVIKNSTVYRTKRFLDFKGLKLCSGDRHGL